jgi:hypothetical protein
MVNLKLTTVVWFKIRVLECGEAVSTVFSLVSRVLS